jgi:pimeloyl-ACP methyl ester carboxylesterase
MANMAKEKEQVKHAFKPAGTSTTTTIENKRRTEIAVKVKKKVIAFWIGGAGDKESYYFSGPFHNVRDARDLFESKIVDLEKRDLYSSYYLDYSEAKGFLDVKEYATGNIPDKTTPVYIVGHSLGGWNGAHLSAVLSKKGYNVEMLITLDPVGEGALVYVGSDIYRSKPEPASKFWVNIRATPKKPDQSDSVAEFGERWTVTSGPALNYIADINHYNAKKMFLAPLKDTKSAADLMHESIRKLTN